MPDSGVVVFPIRGQTVQTATVTNAFGKKQVRAPGFTGSLPPINYGVDLAAPEGTPLAIPFDGKIVEVTVNGRNDKGYGNSIMVQRANGEKVRLAHMRDVPTFKVGDAVRADQDAGAVGKTGNATGPHVDVEDYDASGKRVNFLARFGGESREMMGQLTPGAPGSPLRNTPGGGTMADEPKDNPLITEYQDQISKIETRIAATQKKIDDAEKLVADYEAAVDATWSKGGVGGWGAISREAAGKAWLQAQGISQEQYDAAAKIVNPGGVGLDKPSMQRAELTKQLADDKEELTKKRTALATAQTNAAKPSTIEPKGTQKTALAGDYLVTYVSDGMGNWSVDPSVPPKRHLPDESAATRQVVVDRGEEGGLFSFDPATGTLTELKPGTAKQPTPVNVPGVGIYERDPATGQYTLRLETQTPLQKLEAELALAAKQHQQRRDQFTNDLIQQVQDGTLTTPDAQKKLQEYDALHATAAEQMAMRTQELQREQFEETKAAREQARKQQEATNVQSLMGLQQRRQEAYTQAQGQFEQTGVATPGRLRSLRELRQPPSLEMAAQATGKDPNDPVFRKAYEWIAGGATPRPAAALPPGATAPPGSLAAAPAVPTTAPALPAAPQVVPAPVPAMPPGPVPAPYALPGAGMPNQFTPGDGSLTPPVPAAWLEMNALPPPSPRRPQPPTSALRPRVPAPYGAFAA